MINIFIKQGDSLPEIKFPLNQKLLEKYGITDEMMNNVAITFSMRNKINGLYKIANNYGGLHINTNDNYSKLNNCKYELVYKCKEKDTKKIGEYWGEFKIDFLGKDACGSISFPTNDSLSIYITKGITKTSVITFGNIDFNTFDYTFDETFK